MTQEEKELLIKDISGRLLYGLKCKVDNTIHPIPSADDYRNGSVREIIEVTGIDTDPDYECVLTDDIECVLIIVIPYLRPLSSMTESERKEFDGLSKFDEDVWMGNHKVGFPKNVRIMSKCVDWLNRKMFDHRGLIPKGLALESPKGVYNN